jgi:hypothetical protein
MNYETYDSTFCHDTSTKVMTVVIQAGSHIAPSLGRSVSPRGHAPEVSLVPVFTYTGNSSEFFTGKAVMRLPLSNKP